MFVWIWTRTDGDDEDLRRWESVCRLWLSAIRQWRASARGDNSLYTTDIILRKIFKLHIDLFLRGGITKLIYFNERTWHHLKSV